MIVKKIILNSLWSLLGILIRNLSVSGSSSSSSISVKSLTILKNNYLASAYFETNSPYSSGGTIRIWSLNTGLLILNSLAFSIQFSSTSNINCSSWYTQFIYPSRDRQSETFLDLLKSKILFKFSWWNVPNLGISIILFYIT